MPRLVGSIMSSCHARVDSRSSLSVSSPKRVSKLSPISSSVMLLCAPSSPEPDPCATTSAGPSAAHSMSMSVEAGAPLATAGSGRRITCTACGSRSLRSPSSRQSSLSSRPHAIMRRARGSGGGGSPAAVAAAESSRHTFTRRSPTVWLACTATVGRGPTGAPPPSITCTDIGAPRTQAPCRRGAAPPSTSAVRFSTSTTKRRSRVRQRSAHRQSCCRSSSVSADRGPRGDASCARASPSSRSRPAAASSADMHSPTSSRCCCWARAGLRRSEWWSSTRKRTARSPTASSRARSAAAHSALIPYKGTSSTETCEWSFWAKRCSRQLIQRKRYSMHA
mmetsp:Transcript_33827/g.107892  ORF Transcript_33827/g.107892 Transcript_33827/m.107892 type:complete len:336 (+) Transcript_33827:2946-3953(+)